MRRPARLGRKKPEPLFDPHEFGARRSDPALGAFEPLPPTPRRYNNKQLLYLFFLGVVFVAVYRLGSERVPSVNGSCTKPAFALSKTELHQYGVINWSVAGPATSKVVIGIDSSSPPTTLQGGLLTGPLALKDCKAGGLFGVRSPAGDHTVVVYLIDPTGTSTVVGSKKITVDQP